MRHDRWHRSSRELSCKWFAALLTIMWTPGLEGTAFCTPFKPKWRTVPAPVELESRTYRASLGEMCVADSVVLMCSLAAPEQMSQLLLALRFHDSHCSYIEAGLVNGAESGFTRVKQMIFHGTLTPAHPVVLRIRFVSRTAGHVKITCGYTYAIGDGTVGFGEVLLFEEAVHP